MITKTWFLRYLWRRHRTKYTLCEPSHYLIVAVADLAQQIHIWYSISVHAIPANREGRRGFRGVGHGHADCPWSAHDIANWSNIGSFPKDFSSPAGMILKFFSCIIHPFSFKRNICCIGIFSFIHLFDFRSTRMNLLIFAMPLLLSSRRRIL